MIGKYRIVSLSPVLAALAYPFLLRTFHGAVGARGGPVSAVDTAIATGCLAGAFAIPFLGVAVAQGLNRIDQRSPFVRRARRLAYASVAAPPLFVFAGVVLGLLHAPFRDTSIWVVGWLGAALYGWSAPVSAALTSPPPPTSDEPTDIGLRRAHGLTAAVLIIFVLFHLANHASALLGTEVHARVMEAGRLVYRAAWVEPALIGVLLFQVASGLRLAWRRSGSRADLQRVVQVASGVYLAAFLVTHLNSALISARWVRGIETDWAWAAGAPVGLIHDAWNIRLLPHYAFGVFFVLAHIGTGLRFMMLGHGIGEAAADRIWRAGLGAGAILAACIVAALLGVRLRL